MRRCILLLISVLFLVFAGLAAAGGEKSALYSIYDGNARNLAPAGFRCVDSMTPRSCECDMTNSNKFARFWITVHIDAHLKESRCDMKTQARYFKSMAYKSAASHIEYPVPGYKTVLKDTFSREGFNAVIAGLDRVNSMGQYEPIDPGSYHEVIHTKEGWTRMSVQAGNVSANLEIEGDAVRALGLMESLLAKIPSTSQGTSEVFVYPTATGDRGNIGLILADENFPAKISYQQSEPKEGSIIQFSITKGVSGELRTETSKGSSISVAADKKGNASVNFHYLSPDLKQIDKPQEYVISIDDAGQINTATVKVGLGFVFARTKYLQGSFKSGTYPLVLNVKSGFYPDLNVGRYLFNAEKSGVWQGKKPGFHLVAEWQNNESGNRGENAHKGYGRLAWVDGGATAILSDGNPIYYMTDFPYPAVEIKNKGTFVYRINADVGVLNDKLQWMAQAPGEGLLPPGLVSIVTDAPEEWYQSLACSFEATDIAQYVLLETAKMMPVYGDAVDGFGTATALACKLLKGEYESTFYDLGNVLGGKYLEHLKEPANYAQLTAKQQTALDLAKAAYDKLGEKAQRDQREALIKKSFQRGERDRNVSSEEVLMDKKIKGVEPQKPTDPSSPPSVPPEDFRTRQVEEAMKELGQKVKQEGEIMIHNLKSLFQ